VYQVLLEQAAQKDLKRLSSEIFERIISSIRLLGENPRPSGCRKLGGSKNDWRIRIGDYRVIYEINDRLKVVRVMKVRHRKEVYQ
jgi:mRNA interferase RelE/StbE